MNTKRSPTRGQSKTTNKNYYYSQIEMYKNLELRMKEAATWSLLPDPRFHEIRRYMIRSRMAAMALSLSQEKLKAMLLQNFGANKVHFWRCASGKWKNQKSSEKKTSGNIEKHIVRVLGFSCFLRYQIMLKCWQESPMQRPTFEELVKEFDACLLYTSPSPRD